MLFISAHPDDAFLGAGGVILKHSLNDNIAIVNVTSAEKGLPLLEEPFLKAVREKEQAAICKKIGVTVEFLHVPDLKTTFVKEDVLSKIIVKIREYTPDVVVTHFPHDVHPDHKAVGAIVKTACHLATFPAVCQGTPHKVKNLFMWEEYSTRLFTPVLYVDITSEYERKKEILKEYKTQYPLLTDVFSHAELQPRIRGIEAGVRYAEAFHCPRPAVVDSLSHFGKGGVK